MSTPRKPRSWHQDRVLTINLRAAAEVVDQHLFTADRAYDVESASYVATVAGSDGSAVTADLKVCDGTEAPSAGTTIFSSTTFNLKGTANTVQSPALATSTRIASGERLALDVTGTPTAVAGAVITVVLRPVNATAFA
jgi:hypothetical protein